MVERLCCLVILDDVQKIFPELISDLSVGEADASFILLSFYIISLVKKGNWYGTFHGSVKTNRALDQYSLKSVHEQLLGYCNNYGMELLYIAYQQIKQLRKIERGIPPSPSQTKMTQTQNIRHYTTQCGSRTLVPNLEKWGSGYSRL